MASRYDRPLLPWIRRRARRLMRCHGVPRHDAVQDAANDYRFFVGRGSAATAWRPV
ncbi:MULTISPECIES: hypothetical protein [unclassified Variovorax]|uniref:hypothetical protein n=1 Tax=unclassified Variovorax TaxID=663243 RepID=UPI0013DEF479|nr:MULTISPECIES: hypothetical protein [unclassified Variovorax]